MAKNKQKSVTLYQFLKYVLFVVIAIIIAGSVFSLFKKKDSGEPLNSQSPSEIRGKKALYSDLGKLRIPTADESGGTLVVFPVLEYNSDDKAFEEEIVQKKEKIRKSIIDWFSQKTAYELYTMPETEVKKELLGNINSLLNLSRIKHIYFKEFVILE
ncbi:MULTISPECIES: flagellar basal body-associated FliL family protein [unclassified Treponema]|uniref:flagellar basal body-associated FliL family protein n=1 Tax=unclassified Treponema TaxID=2638727 RepID=UPI0020A3C46B|nr:MULTISPECIES: flagellar basal body-associated FliL family protein [unclassified Treponema]UTC66093.1 flagellar basal body-associated FliL family protein [Treponema sp. OMZ 789]UTC68823.1 flagellar basal body-associated FliL family protein [Treponema sp. OMZ 790]UTC71551.1 flagellar basal body-associated FliL family protein [Treponema sp. OMZ 791]